MRISFYGAAGEVTGSNFLVESGDERILIDCGMFQGTRFAEEQNYETLPYDVREITAMILTHAHLDHCGRIPKLWRDGFRGKIYATPPTRDLAGLVMADAAAIMSFETEEDDREPLYEQTDVEAVLGLFEQVDYRRPTKIGKHFSFEFFDAGHILGSASVLLEAEGKKVVFSGDIGNYPVPMMNRPEVPVAADAVVMESTYGGRYHESPVDRRSKLRTVIKQTLEQKGVLLIPAFALERTQELLYELSGLSDDGLLPHVPVFLDSPMAIAATEVYESSIRYFNHEAQVASKIGNSIFSFPGLKITESVGQSKAINAVEGSKIIIAGSGMMEGGRIQHHAQQYLSDATTALLFVGYQGEGTLGRALYEGRRRVKILRQWVNVKARVVAIGAYSAHADQRGLEEWLGHFQIKPKKVYLVHGEADGATKLAAKIKSQYDVAIPQSNDEVEL